MKEALYYKKLEDGRVQCELCPHFCFIQEGQAGRCRVRKNIGGKLHSVNFGELSAIQIDPIEKKPLMHFMTGTKIFSVGSYGCNMRCRFCQNHDISMDQPEVAVLTPEEIVEKALELGIPSIAYTYNEPTVFYEMMLETAVLAHEKGLKNVIVTNGLINEEPLLEILPYIDAMNIDLKSYSDEIYKDLGGALVADILRTIEIASKSCHVEVTMLIVPGISDDVKAFEEILGKLREKAPDIVLHLSRYFPRFLMDEPATDVGLMIKMKDVAKKYFEKVYLGNVRV